MWVLIGGRSVLWSDENCPLLALDPSALPQTRLYPSIKIMVCFGLCFFFFFYEAESVYVAQAGLKLQTFQPQPPEDWNDHTRLN